MKHNWRVLIIMAGLLLLLAWPVVSRAGGDLPPRLPPPTEQPDRTGDTQDRDDDDSPVGAYIELDIQPVPGDLWTVVQWQDVNGDWHSVEGWQGTPSPAGTVRWWVAAKDFEAGPFRWLVRHGKNGPVVVGSPPFYLPAQPNELLQIEISVD